MNHYEFLGVQSNANSRTIRRAANRLARKFHSDTSSDGQRHPEYQRVIEAKRVLLRTELRDEYDLSIGLSEEAIKDRLPGFDVPRFSERAGERIRDIYGTVKVKARTEKFIGSRKYRVMLTVVVAILSVLTMLGSAYAYFSAVVLGISLVPNPLASFFGNLFGVAVVVGVSVLRTYFLRRLRWIVSAAVSLGSFVLFALDGLNAVYGFMYFLLCIGCFALMSTRARKPIVDQRADARTSVSKKFIDSHQVFGDDLFVNTSDSVSEPLRRETAVTVSRLIDGIPNAKVFNRIENRDFSADHVVLTGSDLIVISSAVVRRGSVNPDDVVSGNCVVYTTGLPSMRNTIRNLRAEFPHSRVRAIVLVVPENGTASVMNCPHGEVSVATARDLSKTFGSQVALNPTPVDLSAASFLFLNSVSRHPTSA